MNTHNTSTFKIIDRNNASIDKLDSELLLLSKLMIIIEYTQKYGTKTEKIKCKNIISSILLIIK